MRGWLASLVRGRGLEVALALALGYAVLTLAESVAAVATSVLAQHFGRDPFGDEQIGLLTDPLYLNFEIGDTAIFYGQVVSAAIALSLVTLGGIVVLRQRDRELGECPHCASRIPYESTHCAYCGSGIAPAEP